VGWPAWYLSDAPTEGTCYLRPGDMPRMIERHSPRGQAWRYRNKWSTYIPSKRLAYKTLDRLQPSSPEDFWTIMKGAEKAGMNPPTSFADMFMHHYRVKMPRISVVAPFMGRTFGGWQEAVRRGQHAGRVYHYDLNSAYRWAACAGLPDLKTAYPTMDYTLPCAVYMVRAHAGDIPWSRYTGLHMVTSEERDALDLQAVKVLYGVGFSRMVDLASVFAGLDEQFPYASKRISRAFWGMWNTREAPEQVSFKQGERARQMRNPFYNPIWSAFVTSRVKIRMHVHRRTVLQYFVDAVHTTEPIETGTGIGEWKEVGQYDNFWLRAPGQWGDGEYTLKYTGRGSVLAPPRKLPKFARW
jgi:hypothetical protein